MPNLLKRVFLLAFMLAGYLTGSTQNYNLGLPFIKYYPSSEYNAGIQNWAIAQNKYGVIYIANNFGVLEYDGTTWRTCVPGQGVKVRHIALDNEGKIFVACQGDFGYFFPEKSGNLTFTSLADSLPQKYRNFDETWRVFLDTDQVIFATFQNIFIYNKQSNKFDIIDFNSAPENFFYTNHQLYISQLQYGLSYLSNGEMKTLSGTEELINTRISSIIGLSNGNLWIATADKGIYLYDGNKLEKWLTAEPDIIKESTINCAIRLRNGDFALGTQNNGIIICNASGKVILHINKTKGLNNRTILSLFEDSQSNLWLGHNNGITYVELGMPFRYINEQAGLPGTGYDGYLDGQKLYLGTNNGLYYKDLNSDQNFEFVQNSDGQVYSIDKIKSHLLMGHHRGAFEVKGTEAEFIKESYGAWTFMRLKNHPDYFIEGTYNGLLLLKEIDGKLVFQNTIKGFSESSRVMEQDENGDIWMTHGYKGVFRLKLNDALDSVASLKYYGPEDGLPSKLLINVYNIRNRLVFTSEHQIYRYDPKSDRFVEDEFFSQFFDDAQITTLAEDPFQNIYYLSSKQIGVLEKDAGGDFQKKSSVFNKLKNMLNDDLQNISVLSTNQILFGAKEGFILYNVNGTDITQQDFSVLIRKVELTGDHKGELFNGMFRNNNEISNIQPKNCIKELPYKQNSLQISYSSPYVDGLRETKYRYWLENSEKSWSPWTTKTDKEYTNLPEGTYTFHVKAKNIYGKVSETASYSFVILPPWYRTTLAYFTYVIFILSSLFTSFYLFDKKHKKEKQAMSMHQKKEIHKKNTEIETITKQSEEEIQRLKNDKLQSEIENKNKELATSTMHIINKNGFIANIKSNLNSISKRSKNQEVKKELKKIVGDIDRNISQDDDWEQFSFHFDQVHGDFTNRLKKAYPNLSPQEMKLSAYLRMNLSTKEVAHLLNISVRGVEICRYRLRKKLELERSVNLQEFILKF